MPNERARALNQTRELLQEMADASRSSHLPENLRVEAKRLLRHYPEAWVVDVMRKELPQWYR